MSGCGDLRRLGWLGTLALASALLLAAPVRAAIIEIGGIDAQTQYTGALAGKTTPPRDAGVLTFDDQVNGSNTAELGIVSSCADQDENLCADFGLDLVTGKVGFAAVLSATKQNGDPFDPATDNIKQSQFEGMSTTGADFYILDPDDNTTILLTFALDFLEVSQAEKASTITGDPDGLILLGDPTVTATSSRLTVSGGSLNQLVGGPETEARLEVLMSTLDPPILTKGDFKGYFNANFLSGFGSEPVSTTTWNLTIIPEPSTAALVGIALVGLVGLARRQARSR